MTIFDRLDSQSIPNPGPGMMVSEGNATDPKAFYIAGPVWR